MNQFIKSLIFIDEGFLLITLGWVIYFGARARVLRDIFERRLHRSYLTRLFVGFMVMIALVLMLRRDDVLEHGRITWLLSLHFVLDALFIILTCLIVFRYSGDKRNDLHRYYAYWGFIPIFLGVLVTGSILTWLA